MEGYQTLDSSSKPMYGTVKRRNLINGYDDLDNGKAKNFSCSRSHVVVAVLAVCLVALMVGLSLGLAGKSTNTDTNKSKSKSGLSANFSLAAVAIDGKPCATVGKEILEEGGTAVDAAVAALVCNGVYNSQSMGLGGGFLMTIYTKGKGVETLNAREVAPAAATRNMYHGDSSKSSVGPLSVAVPGEVAGYWEARRKYGNASISWKRLLQPTIDMCRNGIPVSWTMANTLKGQEFEDKAMRDVFVNPETGKGWKEGDFYTRPNLADTLEKLANASDEGVNLFYKGDLGKNLVEDLKKLGGILTEEDLANYVPHWSSAVDVNLKHANLTMYSVPPPSSGAVLGGILNIIDHYRMGKNTDVSLLYHRVVEAFKWGYGARTILGDPLGDPAIAKVVEDMVANLTSDEWAMDKMNLIDDNQTVNDPEYYGAVYYNPTDDGTAHVSVIAPNGDAVSATSSVNLIFGSMVMSPSTGIIFNDQMDDFSSPDITNGFDLLPSPNNFIKPGKRPLSSMSPTILVDKNGDVRMVVGASGGTKIITAIALTVTRHLWLGENLETSVDDPRIHHQLVPMTAQYEEGFPQVVVQGLADRGHVAEQFSGSGSTVGVLARHGGRIVAKADRRKAGGVDGF